MDKRVLFRALMWSLAAFFAWQIIAFRIWGPAVPPQDPATTQPAGEATPALEGDQRQEPAAAPTGPATAPPAASTLTARGAHSPQTFILGSVQGAEDSPYRMQLELSNVGASIVSATLSDSAQEVEGEDRYRLVGPVQAVDGRQLASLSVEKITVDTRELSLDELVWKGGRGISTSPPGETATFTLDLIDPQGQPVLRLTRRYYLPQQPAEARRYDLEASLTVTNLDQVSHEVVVTLHGPVGVHRADERMDDRAVSVGNWLNDEVALESKKFSDVMEADEITLHDASWKEHLWWAAVDNKFFTWIVVPLTAGGGEAPDYVADLKAVDLGGSAETTGAVTVRFVCAERSLAPGGEVAFALACYLGPKDRKAFSDAAGNPDYVRRNYYLLISRMYTWCSFSWLTELMISLLDGLHRVIPNYGVAIIILVLVVRVLLHPITKKGQVNMMKMQKEMGKLAPKIEELKKKYANDKGRLNTEMQQLYRTEGINPAGQMMTCLPMMLQMPIWIALYTSLNNNIAIRHEPFCLWIRDLTAPDALIRFGGEYSIPLLSGIMGPVTSLNILPILWAFSMYAQQKLMPKPKPPPGQKSAQTDQAAQMQKMMPIMSIFFALLFYNAPSGLTLYIMASTVIGIIEQWRIRKHIKEMEAEGGRRPEPRPSGGPFWWRYLRQKLGDQWGQLQKQAEQAQKLRTRPKK